MMTAERQAQLETAKRRYARTTVAEVGARLAALEERHRLAPLTPAEREEYTLLGLAYSHKRLVDATA